MAKYVKVSTIGTPYLKVDTSIPFADTWEIMKQYLTEEMNQVLPDKPDLIVLPEVCDIPDHYPKTNEFVDFRGDGNIDFFAGIARENNCNISFSTIMRGKGDYYTNTTCILHRDGSVAGLYDKYYVVPTEYDKNIRCGTKTPLIPLDFGNVACAICFDLNFEDLRDSYKDPRPDLILFASMYHGGIKQQMWAQTCKTYFVGSISHSRPSAIISPIGEIIAGSTNATNYATASINLDFELVHLDQLIYSDKKRAMIKEKYGARITIYDPGNIGYVMLSSEMDDLTAADVLKEFELETYGEYMRRSVRIHNMPEKQGEHR